MFNPIVRKLDFSRWLLITAAMVAVPGAFAQANNSAAGAQPKAPAYDVVTIKPNNSGSGSSRNSTTDYNFTATNVSLMMLLAGAYDIKQDDLISGITAPLKSARFDIQAKITDPDADGIKHTSAEQRTAMLQTLLAQYFQLKVHTETRVLPVYELVVMPGGIKFKELAPGGHIGIHNTQLTAQGIPMEKLAAILSGLVQRTVVDKTGLTATYDIALSWSNESSPPDSPWPSIFTAVQEQLGLKLESAKGPVQTLVIDHVEMPSEN